MCNQAKADVISRAQILEPTDDAKAAICVDVSALVYLKTTNSVEPCGGSRGLLRSLTPPREFKWTWLKIWARRKNSTTRTLFGSPRRLGFRFCFPTALEAECLHPVEPLSLPHQLRDGALFKELPFIIKRAPLRNFTELYGTPKHGLLWDWVLSTRCGSRNSANRFRRWTSREYTHALADDKRGDVFWYVHRSTAAQLYVFVKTAECTSNRRNGSPMLMALYPAPRILECTRNTCNKHVWCLGFLKLCLV